MSRFFVFYFIVTATFLILVFQNAIYTAGNRRGKLVTSTSNDNG